MKNWWKKLKTNIPKMELYWNYQPLMHQWSNALTDFEWVSLEEAKNYDLIEGIYEELEILDKKLKTNEDLEWKKKDFQ